LWISFVCLFFKQIKEYKGYNEKKYDGTYIFYYIKYIQIFVKKRCVCIYKMVFILII